ncbi:Fanconi anemia group I protein-like isoform X1 [Zingiber officinale]|uniref:Fanconi anemia group I protein n=1 Tax=Zingiber officinale TaxID=94328 RepID=A0A8J5G4Z9_ZINOF|nr:Fanconi anemia group I protein-like isoform X1 [Zingiber officinale]KAG6501138.1 hypothetical protein ZIOFF_041007 [Zingiber officinale]
MASEAEILRRDRPPPSLTAEAIITLAQDPSATLPPVADPAALLAPLDHPFPTFPVSTYLSALLSLLSRSRSPPSSSLLSSLLISFLTMFHSRRFPRHDAALLLRLFTPHLSFLDRSQILALVDLILSRLSEIADPEDALPLDHLPRLLELAGVCEPVDLTVERLLAAEWSKALLLKVVALLRELPPIGRARVSDFLDRVFLQMKGVDLQDLPSLIYQLLLLASKCIHRKEVIRGILAFLGSCSKGRPSIMRQVEGTILMHVNFSVKQDPSLGQEMLMVIRSDLQLLNHFAVTVLFSMARVRRFNESSIVVLKLAVVTSLRNFRISRNSEWLPDKLREDCLETAKFVENSVLKAVNESNSGREHVVPSIVQFGFLLLENVDDNTCKQVSPGLMNIRELSIQILRTVFEVHDMSRNEIIEQCKFRIISLKPQKSMQIIKLLSNLVRSYPYAILQYVAHLKEALDYFTFLQEIVAVALVDAILPLVRFCSDLQDYIILVVRKAMFKREDTIRIAATIAVVNLICIESKSNRNEENILQESSSQASCSQQAEIPSRREGNLFLELSGLFRRCLTQQVRVKEILYEGLVKLVMSDPSCTSSILDILWPHFLQVCTEDKDFPLQLDSCFRLENGKVRQVEPLDHLLSCVSWILHQSHGVNQSENSWQCFGFSLTQQENEAGKATSAELFSKALSKIRKNLKNCKLQDYEVQAEESSRQHLLDEKIICNCQILLRLIEVLVNIVVIDLEKAESSEKLVLEKEIMEFSEFYDFVEKELIKISLRTGNRKGPSSDLLNKVNSELKEIAQVNQARTFFATTTVHHLLVLSFNSCKIYFSSRQNASQKSSESSTAALCLKTMSFSLKVCLRHLKSVYSMKREQSGDPFSELLCGDIKCLGKSVMQLVLQLKSTVEQEKDMKKKDAQGKISNGHARDLLFLSLMCLIELFKMNLSEDNLYELVTDLLTVNSLDLYLHAKDAAAEDINQNKNFVDDYQNMSCLHLFLEKVIEPLHSSLLDQSLFQECEALAELLLITGKMLPPGKRNFHGSWAMKICQSRKVENPGAARSVFSLAIHLTPTQPDLTVANDMATELLKVMGSEDSEPEEMSVKFSVINQSTRNAISTIILQVAESCLGDLDWVISKIKAIYAYNREQPGLMTNLQFGEKLSGLELEDVLCARSESLVYLLSSFVMMNLKDSQAEQLLKVATRFYKILALVAKLQIAPKGCKQFLPSRRFQKLTEVTCTRLTSPLYGFVALVQRNQQERASQRGIINKIKRENRCIPDLIFQIEDYEKYLIQLSKMTKVNLLRHAKRSTARDFKILETKKVPVEEEAPEHEPTPSHSTSENELNRESEETDDDNIPKRASPEPIRDIVDEDSENGGDDQEILIRKKRAKMRKVVENSDAES